MHAAASVLHGPGPAERRARDADAVFADLDRVLNPGIATFVLPANLSMMTGRALRHYACDTYRDGRWLSMPIRDAALMRARPRMLFRHAPITAFCQALCRRTAPQSDAPPSLSVLPTTFFQGPGHDLARRLSDAFRRSLGSVPDGRSRRKAAVRDDGAR